MGNFQNQLDFETSDTDLPKEIRQFAQLDDKDNYAKELAQLLNFLHHHWSTDDPDSDYEDRSDELSTEKINGIDLAAEPAGQFLQTQANQNLGAVSDQEIVDILNDEIGDGGDSSISTLQEQVEQNDSDIGSHDTRITNNSNDIGSHDTRITNNSNDIGTVDGDTSLQQQIEQNDSDIDSHDTRITNNSNDIDSHDTRITNNSNDIDSHDTRITNNSNDIGAVDGDTTLQQQIDKEVNKIEKIDIESSGNEAIGIPKFNEGELSDSEKASLAQQAGDDRAALVMIDGTVGHLTQ
jgi:hypothetical protein